MINKAISIRPFIGAKDYELSKQFYRHLGFREKVLSPDMCLFQSNHIAFYLQKYYRKDWIDNSMIFVEVADVEQYWDYLTGLELATKFAGVKLTPIKSDDWGRECFLHDPSGILWHFGQFTEG